MTGEDWRIPQDARDHFVNQDKRTATEQRRPVIKSASDLVGPGIGAEAVRITDYNDLLATFNGYYSSEAGAQYAPNDSDPFIGFVTMDPTLGGKQVFTSLVSGNEYTRVFLRNPSDEDSISFGTWHTDEVVPATAYALYAGNSRSLTELEEDEDSPLELPLMGFIGNTDTYARSTTVLSIKRPGVYSGYFWLRTTEVVYLDYLKVEFPNGTEQTFDVLYIVNGANGIQVPLMFYAGGTDGFVRVTAMESTEPSVTVEFNRFHLSRIGDAP